MSNGLRERVPTYDQLLWPLFEAYWALGGLATNDEAYDAVVRAEGYSEDLQLVPIGPTNEQSLLSNRLAWARMHLKGAGLLESPRRALHALTELGRSMQTPEAVQQAVKDYRLAYQEQRKNAADREGEDDSLGRSTSEATTNLS